MVRLSIASAFEEIVLTSEIQRTIVASLLGP